MAMGARIDDGMFARSLPQGEDTLKSSSESPADGQISRMGQRIK